MADLSQQLSSVPLFSRLSPQGLALLTQAAEVVKFRPRRRVVREGAFPRSVYCLLKGSLRVFHRAPEQEGVEVVVKLFTAPAVFGEMEVMLREDQWRESVETLCEAEVVQFPGELFLELLQSEPSMSYLMTKDLCARLCMATEQTRAMASTGLSTRLASFMVDLSAMFGVPQRDGTVVVDLRLSQDLVARSVASSRKSVNQIFSEWKRLGLLKKESARYHILEPARIKELAAGSYRLLYSMNELLELEPAKAEAS